MSRRLFLTRVLPKPDVDSAQKVQFPTCSDGRNMCRPICSRVLQITSSALRIYCSFLFPGNRWKNFVQIFSEVKRLVNICASVKVSEKHFRANYERVAPEQRLLFLSSCAWRLTALRSRSPLCSRSRRLLRLFWGDADLQPKVAAPLFKNERINAQSISVRRIWIWQKYSNRR